MKVFILCFLFALFSVDAQLECGVGYAECDGPENCGNSTRFVTFLKRCFLTLVFFFFFSFFRSGCGCVCPACGSCVVEQNPVLDSVCAANVLLILDSSSSIYIREATEDVRVGARALWNALRQVNEIGGVANLGVMQFASWAEIVRAGQRWDNQLVRVDNDWVNSLDNFIDANVVKPAGYSTYDPFGCTNWGDVLKLAHDTKWCVQSMDNVNVCEEQPLDIILFFTDGDPTISNGTCNSNCNSNRQRSDGSGVIGPDFGDDAGIACYWSDIIKTRTQNGRRTKLFIVGVGQANTLTNNIQLITGSVVWDPPSVETFPSSDYIIDASFENLGAIFFNIARGLCFCLQDQLPCIDPQGSNVLTCAQQAAFNARVIVTTGATATEYPVNSKTLGWIYYDFSGQSGPSTRNIPIYAVEQQFPGTDIGSTAVAKSNLYDACNVVRRELCEAQCFTVQDQSFMPRFFLADGDGPEAPTSGLTSSCGTPYKKAYAPQPESIEYIWVTGNPLSVCAGRALDGTLFEFYKDNAATQPGVNLGGPLWQSKGSGQVYNFDQFNMCEDVQPCNVPLDLVFVLDWQFSDADYSVVVEFVAALVRSYSANPRIRFGAFFSDPNAAIPFQTDNEQFISLLVGTPRQSRTSDFFAMLQGATSEFFPDDFRQGIDVPRYMLTMIGGSDAGSFNRNAWNALKLARGIESWAIGAAQGSLQYELARDIADLTTDAPPAVYNHYQVYGSTSILNLVVPGQAAQMCPTSTTCGPDCQGFCACGTCVCPECVSPDPSNLCLDVCCDATSKLCAVEDKNFLIQPAGCVPENSDKCTAYKCNPVNGTCYVDETCKDNCGCQEDVPNCMLNVVDVNNCGASCNMVEKQCSCDNLCGQTCDLETGFCAGAKNCDDGSSCTTNFCTVKQVGNPPAATAICETIDNSAELCPAESACSRTFCNGTGATPSCSSRPISELLDICGNCLGEELNCTFTSTDTGVGNIVAAAILPLYGAAAVALAVAAALAYKKGAAAGGASSATTPVINDNPAYKDAGIAGDMPDDLN